MRPGTPTILSVVPKTSEKTEQNIQNLVNKKNTIESFKRLNKRFWLFQFEAEITVVLRVIGNAGNKGRQTGLVQTFLSIN